MAKPALGRGLGALLGGVAPKAVPTNPAADVQPADASGASASGERVQRVSPDRIRHSPFQPRKDFPAESLQELADSIRQQGIIQPLVVRERADHFELIAGERRWRAAQLAGLREVPIIVRNVDDHGVLEMALIENLQRENLNPIEEALGYAQLTEQFDLRQEDVATRVGKSRAAVANALRLLKLPADLQNYLRSGRLSLGHAKVILGLDQGEQQILAAERVLRDGLSVRATEELVTRLQQQPASKSPRAAAGLPPSRDVNLAALEDRLRERLGTKVQLRYRMGKGSLEIRYYSDDELERILQILGVAHERRIATMIEPAEFREQCAVRLLISVERVSQLQAFVGLDGFVDEIVHVVDKRDGPDSFRRLETIGQLSGRIASAAGQSTNIELVNQRIKLGGNGPIMANALARLGIKVTYVGALGYPVMHPVFNEFARRAEVHSVAEPGHTDALEFEDGKVMFGKTQQLSDVTWDNIQARYGRDRFIEKFSTSNLVGFVNWTMVPHMSDLWGALLREFCPSVVPGRERRKLFFDLADPEKRTRSDISAALDLISRFENYFEVILGVNQKEAFELGKVLGLKTKDESRDGLMCLALGIQDHVPISTLVVHPISYAIAVSHGEGAFIEGPSIEKPVITTGAGDHFNSGFCLGKLIGLDNTASLLAGVTASGYYVATGQSPGLEDLASMLRRWPERTL